LELIEFTSIDVGNEQPVATGSQLPESEYVAAELPLLETVKLAVPA
jgi:hypothetical protein